MVIDNFKVNYNVDKDPYSEILDNHNTLHHDLCKLKTLVDGKSGKPEKSRDGRKNHGHDVKKEEEKKEEVMVAHSKDNLIGKIKTMCLKRY